MSFFDSIKRVATDFYRRTKEKLTGVTSISQGRAEQQASTDWLRQHMADANVGRGDYDVSKFKSAGNTPRVGHMYYFDYDPKTRNQLPYFDTIPLIICIGLMSDGWLGINLHYMPPVMRKVFLDRLMEVATNSRSQMEYERVSWTLLQSALTDDFLTNTIKRYLVDKKYFKSFLIEVDPSHWEKVIFLPHQQLKQDIRQESGKYITKNVSNARVWGDTRKGKSLRRTK